MFLLLLANYTQLSDIKHDDELWADAFERFIATAPASRLAWIERFDDLQHAKEQARRDAQQRRDAARAVAGGGVTTTDDGLGDDIARAAADDDDAAGDLGDDGADIDYDALLAAAAGETIASIEEFARDAAIIDNAAAVPASVADADAIALRECIISCESIDVDQVARLKHNQLQAIDQAVAAARATGDDYDGDAINNGDGDDGMFEVPPIITAEASVEAVQRGASFADALRDDDVSTICNINVVAGGAFELTPTFRDRVRELLRIVSSDNKLNELQDAAFVLFAQSFLLRLAYDRCAARAAPGSNVGVMPTPCRLLLVGQGGTGMCVIRVM